MLIDVLRAAVVLVGSGVLCAAALFAAKSLRLDRLWIRLAGRDLTPHQIITELAALAEASSKQGLLSIESAAASSPLPLLQRGIALTISGAPAHEIKTELGASLDYSILQYRRLRSVTAWLATVLLSATILTGAILQLLAAASIASSSVITSIPAPLLLVAFPMFLGIACLPTLRDWASRSDAARLLSGTLVIEGLLLIGSGKDGRAVADHLATFLPGYEPDSRIRAAAA